MTKPTTIYALTAEGEVRYVGKTSQEIRFRMYSHWLASKSPRLPVARWLAKCARNGVDVRVEVLEVVPPDGDWASRERFWISKYRDIGANLMNLTDGGEGLAGHKFTDSHKAKISASVRRGAEFGCLVCNGRFWRQPSAIKNGECKFCSKACYFKWQRGVSKGKGIDRSKAIAAAAAARRAKTSCKRGHEFSELNTGRTSRGHRFCIQCKTENNQRRKYERNQSSNN